MCRRARGDCPHAPAVGADVVVARQAAGGRHTQRGADEVVARDGRVVQDGGAEGARGGEAARVMHRDRQAVAHAGTGGVLRGADGVAVADHAAGGIEAGQCQGAVGGADHHRRRAQRVELRQRHVVAAKVDARQSVGRRHCHAAAGGVGAVV